MPGHPLAATVEEEDEAEYTAEATHFFCGLTVSTGDAVAVHW